VAVLLAAIARTTLVPLFGTAADEPRYRAAARDVGGRAALLGLVAGVAVMATAPLTGPLLTAQLPASAHHAAIATLVLLGPAVALQARGAVGSAVLAGAHRFAYSAWTYTAAAVVTFVAAVPFVLAIGALGAPIAVLTGSTLVAAAHELRLRRVRLALPQRVGWLRERAQWRLGASLVAVSALPLAMQAGLAIAIANVSGSAGDVTRYTYAYFAIVMLVSATSGASSLVALPTLVHGLHRGDREAVRDYVLVAGAPALAIVVPALAVAAAAGRPLLGLVFRGTFDGAQLDQLYELILLLAALAPAYVVIQLVQGAGTATGHRRQFVTAALVATAAALGGALAARGHTEWVAVAHSGTAVLLAAVAARLVLGPSAWSVLGTLVLRIPNGFGELLRLARGGQSS
jgi:O-antigen/teichoic acid export membrane protein